MQPAYAPAHITIRLGERSGHSVASSSFNDKVKHESPSASLSMQMHAVLCQNYSTAENFLLWRKRNLTALIVSIGLTEKLFHCLL